MFGGGGRGGSFGAATTTQFGASAQGGNPFPGGNNAFGGPPSGGNAFSGNAGASPTPFGGGGRGGGRASYPSSRGGRTSYRGGRNGGGRNSFTGDGGSYNGGSYSGGYDNGGYNGGSYNSGGRGGRGGRGSFVDGSSYDTSTAVENPFAQASPSTGGGFGDPSHSISGAAPPFGQQGRGGGRSVGRSGGRGAETVFGSGANMAQPNIRRKSDFGGRGAKSPGGTTFGQAPIFPPLPPTSPPPLPQSTHKPGRGIATPVAAHVTTAFGQKPRSQQPTTGFGADSGDFSGNPFGAAAAASESARTEFGRPQSAEGGFTARAPRAKRQPNAFGSDEGFSDGFQDNGGLEARLTGGRGGGRGRQQQQQPFAPQTSPAEATTTAFGQPQRRKSSVGADAAPAFLGASNVQDEAPVLKPRKKAGRATPQSSPPPTPASTDNGAGGQIIGDQKNKAELSSAENLDGLCVDMCSQTERELHIRVDELSVFEKCFPGQPGRERDLIVKRFQRSSADHKLDIPSELRPLGVLRSTQLYLEQQIMDRELLGPDPRFNNPRTPEKIELYNFCWDRFRMIRKDFVLQNYRGAGGRVHPIAVDVHERIARYHILSEHELCEVQSFVAQQNMEQLGQTLKSLNELYDESRKLGDPSYLSPFEAEFRGYFILCTLDNGRGSDVLKFVKGLPPQIREAPQVKFAMQIFVARHTQDYYQFFKLLRAATYLQACLVFRYIPSMRSIALERMNRSFRGQPYSLADLGELLCFDDLDHAESVCSHHGLDISASEDEDGVMLVNFGGESFETDLQLRQNKNPLPARSSHVFVGEKQGNYLRRDVCRGVTEYEDGEYPMLSKLIEAAENKERMTLYPGRPPYEDEYSVYTDYSCDPYDVSGERRGDTYEAHNSHLQDEHDVHVERNEHHAVGAVVDQEQAQSELQKIASRKAQIDQEMLKMRLLIEERERKSREQQRDAQQSEESAAETRLREAAAKAQAEAEAVKRREALQAKIREEEAARQREELEREQERRRLEELKKAAAEQARVAELQRVADEKRRAEEEQRRRELQRLEDERRRKAAAEEERRRQAELAAEQARLKLEAERRAEMAREAARQKQVQRLKKQRLAVLKLKFHTWRKFVARSKALPRGVSMEATSLVDRATTKPNDVVNWLFSGSRGASDFIGLKRRQFDASTRDDDGFVTPGADFWRPLDIASIAGQAVGGGGHRVQGWKFVVADVLDEGLSSFGSWCAIKCGISSASLDEDERISTVHGVNWSDTTSLAVCCRYLDSNFVRTLSPPGRAKKLAGTSGLLLPLDLSHVLDAGKLRRWEERVRGVLAHLHPARRVGVVVLGFCAASTPRKGDALAAAEAAIQKLKQGHEKTIAFVDGELILEDEITSSCASIDSKIASVFYKMASTRSSRAPELQVVDFVELVDSVVDNALQDQHEVAIEAVTQLQDRLQAGLWKLRDVLHSPSVIDIDAPIPELQATLGTPSHGWNSREAQQKWEDVLNAMTSHRIVADSAPMAASKVCEQYFEQIQQLVDAVFAGKQASSSNVSVAELKQSLYGLLLPVHDELVAHHATHSTIHDASRLLPWRAILRQILGAFVESLNETLIYLPAHVAQTWSRTTHPDATSSSITSVGASRRVSRKRFSWDAAAQAAAVAFARNELKRAYNGESEEGGGVKRLCHETARERASTVKYQQFLRREMAKWSSADESFSLLS